MLLKFGANTTFEMYAALHEWRTGTHKATNFSADAFLDVYQGHVNTFRFILEKRPLAFHAMMNDIHTQARCVSV